MGQLFETMALIMMAGVIAAAWLPAFLLDKVFGIGYHPLVSAIIGSVVGLIILFIKPASLGVVAMIAAAVVSIVSSVIQEKFM